MHNVGPAEGCPVGGAAGRGETSPWRRVNDPRESRTHPPSDTDADKTPVCSRPSKIKAYITLPFIR